MLDSLKEFDLVVISETPFDANDPAKFTKSIESLMDLKKTKGRMLGYVQSRRKKDALFIKVSVDKRLH